MQIGQLATLAGVNIQTLRYYERQGLLPEPDRRASGYREYEPETVALVRFVKRAQELGFTLREIGELISLRDSDSVRRPEVRALAAAKIEDVERKIRGLSAMRTALRGLVDACSCGNGMSACPIIEALDEPSANQVRAHAASVPY